MSGTTIRALAATWAVALLPAAASAGDAPGATIRYTPYGLAHVEASTYEGVGYGYGFALARDNLCVLVERAVTQAGERSRTLPADAKYYDSQSFSEISNLDSDAVYLHVLNPGMVRRVEQRASPEIRQLVRGFARGFNRHAAGPALDGEACRQQPWYRPLREDDVWRRIAHTPLLETTARLLNMIVAAQPPTSSAAPDTGASTPVARLPDLAELRGASNAIAFGRDAVEGGVGGMSFSNPHYVWHGSERLHAMHLTVPGKLDVFGGTLYGLPFPILGFTDRVGWSITHTTDKRVTLYELRLDAEDPTRYWIGNRRERMRAVKIDVATAAGTVQRVFWRTRYGLVVQGENLPWDRVRAYTLADPELDNTRFADTFLAIARATNVHGIGQALQKHQGAPWSNVTAADRDGEVFYSNITVAANVTDAQLERCAIDGPARRYMERADVTTLDGSDPSCAWTVQEGTPQPGIIPAGRRPWMIRSDVTFNANDSHWFATLAPDGRLEGFPRVIGPERTARGERTRVSALYAREAIDGGAITGTPGATPAKWEKLFFSARNLTAELTLDDLLAACRADPAQVLPDGANIDLRSACDALSRWDRKDTASSRGSALFGEFLRNLSTLMPTTADAARFWRVPFDPADPVGTPSGLVVNAEVRLAFARAVQRFQTDRLPFDAPLRDLQAVTRNGVRIPISGSSYGYHRISPGGSAPGQGITEIRAGDSYIHVAALRPDGVDARFMVTYSQSTNPSSPHFYDMTALYSQGSFATAPFSAAQIRAEQVGEPVVFTVDEVRGRP